MDYGINISRISRKYASGKEIIDSEYLHQYLRDIMNSTPTEGQLFYYDGSNLVPTNELTYDNVTNQLTIDNKIADRSQSVIIETTTISNSIQEETLYLAPVNPNELSTKNHLKIDLSGVLENNSATDDLTFKIYIGTTLIESFSPTIGNVDGDWHTHIALTLRSIGESGEVASHIDTSIAGYEEHINAINPINTTISQDIKVTVQWDNAKVDNIISIYQGILEYKY